jgi:ferredoxin
MNCGICADVCPEAAKNVLKVHKVTDMNTLSRGRVPLLRHEKATCEACGADIASVALLQHIKASLGDGKETLLTAISRYCPSCRASRAWGATPSSV